MMDHPIGKRRTWSIFPSIALIWGGMAVAAVIISNITRAPLPGVLDVALYRPVMFLVALLAAVLVVGRVYKIRADSLWHELMSSLPTALVGAVSISMFGVWNDGSGIVALTIRDACLFVLGGGLWPAAFGPDVLLRMTVLCLAVFVGWRAAHRQLDRRTAIKRSILIWIVGSCVLLLQTWFVQLIALARSIPIQTSVDASRVMGTVLTDSYWSNFQADRFLTGIGQQFETGMTLSTTSLAFLLGCVTIFCVARSFSPWSRPGVFAAMMKRIMSKSFFLLGSALVSVTFIGLNLYRYRATWTFLDTVSFLLLLIVFSASYGFWVLGQEIEDISYDETAHPERPLPSGLVGVDDVESIRAVLCVISWIGSFLLGWPVMIVVAGAWIMGWLRSSQGFGWRGERWGNSVSWAALGLCAAVMGGVFSARSALLSPALLSLAFGWALLAALLHVLPLLSFHAEGLRRFIPYGYMLAASVVFGILVNTPVVIAIMAFILLGLYLRSHIQDQAVQLHYASWGVIVFGWASVLLMRLGK